jgi:hypothetical protein
MRQLMILLIATLVPMIATAGDCTKDKKKFCQDVIDARGNIGASCARTGEQPTNLILQLTLLGVVHRAFVARTPHIGFICTDARRRCFGYGST